MYHKVHIVISNAHEYAWQNVKIEKDGDICDRDIILVPKSSKMR